MNRLGTIVDSENTKGDRALRKLIAGVSGHAAVMSALAPSFEDQSTGPMTAESSIRPYDWAVDEPVNSKLGTVIDASDKFRRKAEAQGTTIPVAGSQPNVYDSLEPRTDQPETADRVS